MKFTGHERDDLTGLDYMKARYSGWFQASFLIPDPANDVNPRNPQSWNRYAYVRNNPMNLVDPLGLATQWSAEPTYPGNRCDWVMGCDDFGVQERMADVNSSPDETTSTVAKETSSNGANKADEANKAEGGGDPATPAAQSVTGTFPVPVVPGAGSVRTELFIAAESALGLAGDARDFDPVPNPTNSRAFFMLDFESGAGAFQINPSCAAGGGSCNSALPIGAGNAFNTSISGNSITVTGSLTNSKITIGPSIDFGIRFTASSSGVTFSGYRNAFPSLEITRGSTFLYRGAETHPLRLFDATGFVRFSGP
jgi:RHS repeat-associated protein